MEPNIDNESRIKWIEISSKRYGSVWYNQQARKALAKHFSSKLLSLEAKYFKKRRYLKFFESFYYLFKLRGEESLWIRDFYSVLSLSKKRTKGKNLALIFHIDFLKFPLFSKIPFFLLEKFVFYRQLKKVDAIVVIAEYWRKYFLEKGYPYVYKVYCGFDLNDFNISNQEVLEFKKKHNIEGKPIIYLGNCQKAKGVVDSYNALKGLDVHFVTSGRRQADIPALNIDLDYRDYLKLLKASSIAVTMSKFKEGWCITTHEAMLLKTPSIGSGLGGQQELLEGGKQIVCKDFKNLRENVEYLLNHPEVRKKMGEDGYNFAKDFTMERFEQEWTGVVKKIIN